MCPLLYAGLIGKQTQHNHVNGYLEGFLIINLTNYNTSHLTLDIGHCDTRTNRL